MILRDMDDSQPRQVTTLHGHTLEIFNEFIYLNALAMTP